MKGQPIRDLMAMKIVVLRGNSQKELLATSRLLCCLYSLEPPPVVRCVKY